jgi:biopolymer transport protein ExbD
MAIQTRNKISASFSISSMSDLVFFLMIFFMITTTLVAPNAIKLLLPATSSKTLAKPTITVYINEKFDFFVEELQVNTETLESRIAEKLDSQTEGTVILKADKSVPVQHIVTVIDAVNRINLKNGTKHQVILSSLIK